MFGIKTFIKNNILYPESLFPKDDDKFPAKPVSRIRIKARLFGVLNKLKEHKKYLGLGNLLTFPRKEAIDVWKMLLPYNPNNLGNWSIKGIKPNQETTAIERELIWQMIDLYHGNKDELEGYVTSGGTEANIFSAWLGRKFLLSKGIKREQICLIKTSLTHYSIEKAADIVDVPTFITPLNEKTWDMDIDGLEKTVKELANKGYRGFLISLTLGYTITGTIDPYKEICKKVRVLEKKLEVKFFVWIDAALNGLIEPFLNTKFRPFDLPEIQTFLTDFHKVGFVPIPAGVVLYRSQLRKLVEKPIDYLSEKDNTLLGSRSGIAPVACWMIINNFGRQLFKNKIQKCLSEKKKFISQFDKNKSFRPINIPTSLTCGVIQVDKKVDLAKIEKKFNLKFRENEYFFTSEKKTVNIAKAHFLNF